MAEDQDKTLWKYLSEEAKAGRLDLDPSVSNDCLKACEDELQVYRNARKMLTRLADVSGFGDFPAADALAKMLGAKAVGGEGDFDSALAKHIEVLELIRDTIKYSVDRLVDHDHSQAAGITTVANK
jgi:hypothetical protein